MTTKPFPVEIWPISKIKPYPKNAKKHPEEQIKALAASIKRFGWTQPIVVDANHVIIAGHGRRMAAIALELDKVPVVVRDDLSEVEANALRLADNKVASTEYDMAMVRAEFVDIVTEDASLGFDMGYSEKDFEIFTRSLGEVDSSVFVEDVNEAVEQQRVEKEQKIAEIDALASPLADAFGFRRVSVPQSRKIRLFMTQIEAETGLKGADALVSWIDSVMEPAS